MLPAHVLKYHALRLGHLFTRQSQKKPTPKIGWTKLMDKSEKFGKIKKSKTKKINQLKILEAKIPSKTDPPTSTRAGVGVRTSRNPLRSGTGRFLQAMWTCRANEIFYQKSYKICDQIKLFGDLWRAVFLGKWTLDVDQKIGKNGYMKEKI